MLPPGPLVISPSSFFSTIRREVIYKRPEIFKLSALRDIKSMYEGNPFYAGFGNKESDAIAYISTGISTNKIFIVNPSSELFQYNSNFKKTYKELNQIVDLVFPQVTCKCNKFEINILTHF